METIEERQQAFRQKLNKAFNKSDSKTKHRDYPKWLREDFFEYWTRLSNDNGRKMNFEKEKDWFTMGRLATAKNRVYAKDPRWKTEINKSNIYKQRERMKPDQRVPDFAYDKFNSNK